MRTRFLRRLIGSEERNPWSRIAPTIEHDLRELFACQSQAHIPSLLRHVQGTLLISFLRENPHGDLCRGETKFSLAKLRFAFPLKASGNSVSEERALEAWKLLLERIAKILGDEKKVHAHTNNKEM